jgi:hypothetical protein
MKWVKERDELIAQTKAFVQSVTGRRPQLAAEPLPVGPVESENPGFAENPISAAAADERATSFEPTKGVEPIEIVPVLEAPAVRVLPQSDVRMEIQNRVAAFQAHQHRFHREREAYFKSVLTKVRSAIENGPDTPSA